MMISYAAALQYEWLSHSDTYSRRTTAQLFMVCLCVCLGPIVHAQQVPITSSGLSTHITQVGGNQYNITGGTRPGGGPNLFHSFGEFGIPANNIANFVNETSLPTNNILGRVTGGNISNIFGTIHTEGFGTANLFLMNPAGIIFGPTATLNVGGMVTFTTADYLKLADGVHFNAVHGVGDMLLSAAPVAAFGFLGSNPGDITVQANNFSVNPGQAINLVGGNISIQPHESASDAIQPVRISAREGQINLVSVASAGEILASSFQPATNIALGSIKLGPGTLVDVSGDAAGTVRIRGGNLVMENATVSADTSKEHGAPNAIDIQLTDSLSISTKLNASITSRAIGAGDAGEVRIVSRSMAVQVGNEDKVVVIDTHASSSGKGGDINISTGDLKVYGDPVGLTFLADSGTTQNGSGGNISITARDMILDNVLIHAGDNGLNSPNHATGSSGRISIVADRLMTAFSGISTLSFSGAANDITIRAGEAQFEFGLISASGSRKAGAITLNANTLIMTSTQIESENLGSGLPGGITLNGQRIELTDGSTLSTTTLGAGDAGDIKVTATDHLTLSGSLFGSRPTGIFSGSGISNSSDFLGTTSRFGNAGTITIDSPTLDISGGARINTVTVTDGRGGAVSVSANTVSISGQLSDSPFEPLFGSQVAGGIFTLSSGESLCSGSCGNAGRVSIAATSLSMTDGAQIDSGTSSTGIGGEITIQALNRILLSGALTDGSPVGIFSRSIGTAPHAGSGGNISLTTGQSISVNDGASISAASTGPGNAGNIQINAGQQFGVQNGSITTQAIKASGGNIDIRAIDRVQLTNSTISASVGADRGNGGNITIDPNTVILQNGAVLADAVRGHGGDIKITTPVFLADQLSRVDASSQFGLNGTVSIQSPLSNLSGTVKQLTTKPSEAQALLQNRCVALAGGEQSTFIVTGRDVLPAEPGGWLNSALSMDHLRGHDAEHATAPTANSVGPSGSPAMIAPMREPRALSLRRLTPPGFLVRSFGIDGLTNCRS